LEVLIVLFKFIFRTYYHFKNGHFFELLSFLGARVRQLDFVHFLSFFELFVFFFAPHLTTFGPSITNYIYH